MMAEREYSDEEVAAILKQAAELEHAALPAAAERSGTTLAPLQEIGREVGLSPASIAGAARALDLAGRPSARKFIGLPVGVGRTVELDRPITEPEWEALVADLRSTFSASGTVRYDGPFRQWANGNLKALLEPTSQGHRLRLQTVKGSALTLMASGAVLVGAGAVTLAASAIAGTLDTSGISAGVGILSLSGGALFVVGAASVSAWARRRRLQFEEVVSRLTRSSPADT